MKRLSLALAATLAAIVCAAAQTHKDSSGTIIPATASALGNPSSQLSLTSATTAYASGQLIANNAAAGSLTVPSFTLPGANVTAFIPRLRVSINDATSTGWGGDSVQIDLWSSPPTFANGDRAAWSVSAGAAAHLGAYSCTFSAVGGDGVYAECAPAVGSAPAYALGGATIYWSAQATSATGVTGASKTMTLTAEVIE